MRKYDFSLFGHYHKTLQAFSLLSLQVIYNCSLVNAALLSADVLDALLTLLTLLTTLVLGAVWLGLLLVDVVVLSTACLDILWRLVVSEARIALHRLGGWLVVLISRDRLAVVDVNRCAALPPQVVEPLRPVPVEVVRHHLVDVNL